MEGEGKVSRVKSSTGNTYVIKSFLSFSFFRPPKAILVPGMYFLEFQGARREPGWDPAGRIVSSPFSFILVISWRLIGCLAERDPLQQQPRPMTPQLLWLPALSRSWFRAGCWQVFLPPSFSLNLNSTTQTQPTSTRASFTRHLSRRTDSLHPPNTYHNFITQCLSRTVRYLAKLFSLRAHCAHTLYNHCRGLL